MAEVAADLRTKPVMPVPTCSCKYVSLLELSITIACKKHPCVSWIGYANFILSPFPVSKSSAAWGTVKIWSCWGHVKTGDGVQGEGLWLVFFFILTGKESFSSQIIIKHTDWLQSHCWKAHICMRSLLYKTSVAVSSPWLFLCAFLRFLTYAAPINSSMVAHVCNDLCS